MSITMLTFNTELQLRNCGKTDMDVGLKGTNYVI